ncbi:family 20 glycosylhydrolase [Leeuwenhoekiella marinoflava]|uniref:beta-N-acetylhexosaminidase n=2 Tax=Leeuwenhoekiella marinoflava TaxID=988 RepID=A0A4Q0PJ62_9FLAO|nr:family 20 glycosylhydrolase [Leeuwenhoekiella marinoflava]RXG27398.1 hexosaminidase [Leeuwenhoekiella marinoflava]SHF70185.1 hexosaminidase [Leeuwenhoekiella marinoflava DSM 3653]
MHYFRSSALAFSCIAMLFFSCKPEKDPRILNLPKTDLTQADLIPKPSTTKATYSAFPLDQYTAIHTAPDSLGFNDVGLFLAAKIKDLVELDIPVNTEYPNQESVIYIHQSDSLSKINQESYFLKINKDSIVLSAGSSAGAFRGIQTLRQLIPLKANDSIIDYPVWPIASGTINDTPLFAYRGAMLDVARHFFTVEEVKKYIDLLAYYKYNMLHLHLTDDQGWRIEIKSWPKLTEIGGATEVGDEPGGFYTQEDYKTIVEYAAQNHITIIPEVDMPGHTNAASVAYPFLNGNGKTPEIYRGTHVGFSTFDTRKDTVYTFIDDVVREISALTPGPYFHIGGDESHVTKKEDYIYFVNKAEKIVQRYNKIMIGWDEVVTADIDTTSIAQFWSSTDNAKMAVAKNLKIIMSPANKAYLDMKYDLESEYGLSWAGYVPIDTAYIWKPESYENIPQENILGIEAPLWSETVSNISELEYLAFPRAIGFAELNWSQPENRDWENYKVRLGNQVPFLEKNNVNYYPSPLIEWKTESAPPKTIKE